jgi:DNA-directed RNA polymerase subunit RPC12/RpoP
VVCPKCRFTADIPRVSRKLKLKCQECGHRFVVRPEPNSQPGGRPLPTEKAPRDGGSSKAPVFILLFILLAAGVLIAGPKLLPELFQDLGLPDLPGLLPF